MGKRLFLTLVIIECAWRRELQRLEEEGKGAGGLWETAAHAERALKGSESRRGGKAKV